MLKRTSGLFCGAGALSLRVLFCLIFGASALAASSSIPNGLTSTEQQKVLGVLGFGSASKLLSSPYPLGGYSGVEISLGSEYIPLADVASLGNKNSSRGDLNYLDLTVGKGLFYNIDIMIQFIPIPQSESISGFAGQIRWAFYEANFLPAALSLVGHTSSMNFNNVLSAETTGFDLVGSVNMRDVSLFVGIGQARSLGSFIGGANGVTSSGQTESADVKSSHSVFGININIGQAFVAMEVDRYMQSTYGGKIGWRF
jgi:hypothetical protein